MVIKLELKLKPVRGLMITIVTSLISITVIFPVVTVANLLSIIYLIIHHIEFLLVCRRFSLPSTVTTAFCFCGGTFLIAKCCTSTTVLKSF